ncbi:hypothetical protein E3O55_08565 [Cryobacterium sp. MDB1-18-2]|uniref:hypothetical protein n=1 Tax=unclassified Cryobacterium TaxID=2649013 RepID=UPI00106D2165|nr:MULTISPECIES: hypothetical protein [unclassified Cryobacterium]TFC30125.1 hypothetical protein E3O55_08565 [Cryobacterium sp. MDB1-18-2]TFC41405.1 hypothetical protein E3O50_10005 [Cryobacterium sp. MDB1-18-1]
MKSFESLGSGIRSLKRRPIELFFMLLSGVTLLSGMVISFLGGQALAQSAATPVPQDGGSLIAGMSSQMWADLGGLMMMFGALVALGLGFYITWHQNAQGRAKRTES